MHTQERNFQNELKIVNKESAKLASELLGKPLKAVERNLTANLMEAKKLAQGKEKIIQALYKNLEKRVQIKMEQNAYEAEQNFNQIEQEVHALLPEHERQRITAMFILLLQQYGDYYKTSYDQAIMKLYNKEVIITPDSVQFLYAHKELYREELQLPKGKSVVERNYIGFDYEPIIRKEVVMEGLNKNHVVQNMLIPHEKEGKFLATQENVFDPILRGFKGRLDQRLRAMQFLTGFIGCAIVSPKKDKNTDPVLLECDRTSHGIKFCQSIPHDTASLLLAKDC